MTKLRASGVLLSATVCLAASPAAALQYDHLKCYKAKDTASFAATVDLRPATNTPFELDAGCTVKVRSRQLCFAVAKDLLTSDGPELDVRGQQLGNAYLCYTVRCPTSMPPESIEMSDQFGTRTFTKLRTSTLCAPAVLGVPVSTTTTTTTLPPGAVPRNCVDAAAPDCDGTCGDENLSCKPDGLGACFCEFVDQFGPCGAGGGPPGCYGSCGGSQSCVEACGACQCSLVLE